MAHTGKYAVVILMHFVPSSESRSSLEGISGIPRLVKTEAVTCFIVSQILACPTRPHQYLTKSLSDGMPT